MKRGILFILLAVMLTALCSEIFATGVLYVRPRFSSQQYQKVWIKSIDTKIEIRDQVAVTHVDQVFYNEMNSSVEAIYIFPLPENAMIEELVYWFNGERHTAEIRERQEAVADYQGRLNQWLDPALLEYLGDNMFRLSIVPVNAQSEVRTEIKYVEMLDYDFGSVNYKYLLNTLELSSRPLEGVSVELDAYTQNKFKFFNSPSHESSQAAVLTKENDQHYHFIFADENFFPDKDLEIEFETEREEVQFNLYTYTPTVQDSMGSSSFYALWVTPPDEEGQQRVPLDLVLTADVSSSMNGSRIEQMKQALGFFVDRLQEGDRFNILRFSTGIKEFRDSLVEANEANLNGARSFVTSMYALGKTNIDEALQKALSYDFRDNAARCIIFLTDGKATMGVTSDQEIITRTREANTRHTGIYTFGIGEEVSASLLNSLAAQNNGYSVFINDEENLGELITNHFRRLSKPAVSDLAFDYGGMQVVDTYPKTLPNLFYGSQVLEMGLYNQGGTHEVTLTGNTSEGAVTYRKTLEFPDTSGGERFVPRLWAKAKIDHLLNLIELEGESDELVEQVIELSLTFQILTEYTAFYSDPTTGVDNEDKIVPKDFRVSQNYPNPFNPETHIKYYLPEGKAAYNVTVKIFDSLGRLVKVLKNNTEGPGAYSVTWNATDESGQKVSSGIYFYQVSAGGVSITKKMILMK